MLYSLMTLGGRAWRSLLVERWRAVVGKCGGAVLVAMVGCFSLLATRSAVAGPRDEAWRLIDRAIAEKQYELASVRLSKLAEEIRPNAGHAELARLIVQQTVVEEGLIEREASINDKGAIIARIVRLQAARERATPEVRALLNVVLVRWYFGFWNSVQRRDQIGRPSKRTFPMDDWTPPQVERALVEQLDSSLADERVLLRMTIDQLGDWLETSDAPARYRATAFDWAANQVLGELVGEISYRKIFGGRRTGLVKVATSFGDREAFLNQAFEIDPTQPLFDRLIRWLKRRVAMHQEDVDPSALVAADLDRLLLMTDVHGMDDSIDHYEQALRRLAERHVGHEVSSLVQAHLARVLIGDGRLKEGEQVAKLGAEAFPESVGGEECRRHLAKLQAPKTTLNWMRDKPTRFGEVVVRSFNLSRVHLRLVKSDFHEDLRDKQTPWQRQRQRNDRQEIPQTDDSRADDKITLDRETERVETEEDELNDDVNVVTLRRMLNRPVIKQWTVSFDKPATTAWQSQRVPIPDDLEPGCYAVLASPDPNFPLDEGPVHSRREFPSTTTHPVCAVRLWASSMNLVLAHDNLRGIQGIVLDSRTGLPLAGARPHLWVATEEEVKKVALPESTTTDEHGLFRLDREINEENVGPYFVMVERGGETIGSWSAIGGPNSVGRLISNRAWEEERSRRFLEIDCERSSYRLGEVVRFRGQVRAKFADGFRPIVGEKVVVSWNVEDLGTSKVELVTDSFGVFYGQFTLKKPKYAWTTVRLSAKSGGEKNSCQFAIDETPPMSPPPLTIRWRVASKDTHPEQVVPIEGVVVDAAGLPVSSSQVVWSVDSNGRSSRKFGAGTVVTDTQGRFAFSFRGDVGMDRRPWEMETKEYSVFVEASNDRGDKVVRDRKFKLHTSNCLIRIVADSWIRESELWSVSISTRNRMDEPIPARGTYTLLKVKDVLPANVDDSENDVPWWLPASPQRRTVARPVATYLDSIRQRIAVRSTSATCEIFREGEWKTNEKGSGQLEMRLPVGRYVVVLEGEDEQGDLCHETSGVFCVSTNDATANERIFEPVFRKVSYSPGETAESLWSGPGVRRKLTYFVHDGYLKPAAISSLDPRVDIVRIPISSDPAKRDEFLTPLTVWQQQDGSLWGRFDSLKIVESRELKLSVERIAMAGDNPKSTTWRAVVRDASNRPVVARVEASCGDSRLGKGWPGYRRFEHEAYENKPELKHEGDGESRAFEGASPHNYMDRFDVVELRLGELKQPVVKALNLNSAVRQPFRVWGYAAFGGMGTPAYDPLAKRRDAMRELNRDEEDDALRDIQGVGPVVTDDQGVAILQLDATSADYERQLKVWAIDERGHEAIKVITLPRAK